MTVENNDQNNIERHEAVENTAELTGASSMPLDQQDVQKIAANDDAEVSANSKFVLNPNFEQVVTNFWKAASVDPVAAEMVKNVSQMQSGFAFHLADGTNVMWWTTPKMLPDGTQGQQEYIGFSKSPKDFSPMQAQAIVALSKTRGWESLDVHGTEAQREMLWLEAQRQGMEVNNFHPKLNSPILTQWKAEKELKELAGVTAPADEQKADQVSGVTKATDVKKSKFAQENTAQKLVKSAHKAAKKTLKSGKRVNHTAPGAN